MLTDRADEPAPREWKNGNQESVLNSEGRLALQD